MNLISFCKQSNIEALILSLDIEKAFDHVEVPFLSALLSTLGFGLDFCRALNNQLKVQIKLNGLISDPFVLSRGTRQGCPLSPLLFAFVIEPLAVAVRSNPDIFGVTVRNQEHKLTLFAGDMTLYITNPLRSLPQVESMLSD